MFEVNTHYLDKVMELADDSIIEASEDIFDARGTKLVAKGTQISRHLQERLIMHKLRKPLEACLTVEGGIDTRSIAIQAERLLDMIEPMRYMYKYTCGHRDTPLSVMQKTELGNAMTLMLTITDRGGEEALAHCIGVSLISICLAQRVGLSTDRQEELALAGLLHDIGELYIEPEYVRSPRRLLPHEWHHVVVHPLIGEMLIRDHQTCSPLVAQCVLEHHERFDGTGYPRRIRGRAISVPGQVMSVSEMISSILFKNDRPLERAELALKIVPGEHAPELVTAVSEILHASRVEMPARSGASSEAHPDPNLLQQVIENTLTLTRTLAGSAQLHSTAGLEIADAVETQLQMIRKAFAASGLGAVLDTHYDAQGDQEVQFEMDVACKEILWRLRDTARNISLRLAATPRPEQLQLERLVGLLDCPEQLQ